LLAKRARETKRDQPREDICGPPAANGTIMRTGFAG
jgi:hypothetical protein